MPSQHHRRHHHTTRRLLLLAAATGAGIGISLAVDSAAHADDDPLPLVGTTADTVHTVLDATLAPAIGTTDPQPAEKQQAARPVSDLVKATTRTVNATLEQATRTVTRLTDTTDRATAPLPVVGAVVDDTTDITDRVLTAVPTTVAPRPSSGDRYRLSTALRYTAHTPQTAPGPADGPPPVADPGAPTATVDAASATPRTVPVPTTAAMHTPQHRATTRHPAPPPPTGERLHGQPDQATLVNGHSVDGTPADWLTPADRWRQSVVATTHLATGRAPSPPPPSG